MHSPAIMQQISAANQRNSAPRCIGDGSRSKSIMLKNTVRFCASKYSWFAPQFYGGRGCGKVGGAFFSIGGEEGMFYSGLAARSLMVIGSQLLSVREVREAGTVRKANSNQTTSTATFGSIPKAKNQRQRKRGKVNSSFVTHAISSFTVFFLVKQITAISSYMVPRSFTWSFLREANAPFLG